MAFTPGTLSVIVQPIGGEGMRFLSYKTDDVVATITATDYFALASSYGVRAHDLIFVSPVSGAVEPYILVVVSIDDEGNATASVDATAIADVAGLQAALDAKQNASANLTAWSALATSAKQDASANLTAWSALATSAKQDASANLTTLAAVIPGLTGLLLLAASTVEAVRSILGLAVRSTDYGTPDLAAAAAFAAGRSLRLSGDTDAILTIDPSSNGATAALRFAYLKTALEWQAGCVTLGAGRVRVRLAQGLHTVEGYYAPRPNASHPVLLDSASVDLTRTITSISFAAEGTANKYTMTVGVSSALPAHVVVGWAIGLQNVCGDNSAEACTGGQIVKTIAGDRLSFTCDAWFNKGAPTNPATIDAATHATTPDPRSLDRSVVVIPNATLSVAPGASGWDGGAIEGFFNIYGGEVYFNYLGMAYTGTAGSTHDLIMVGDGGWFEIEDRSVLAGAGSDVIRMNNRAGGFLNRSCIGGAGKANIGIQTQDEASVQTLRISGGGFKTFGLNAGLRSTINFGGIMASCNVGAQTNQGSTITISNCRITQCATGLWGAIGPIIGDGDTELRYNTTGMLWTTGSNIYGDFDLTGNTTDVSANIPANVLYRNGGWWTSTLTGGFLTASEAHDFGSVAVGAQLSKTIAVTGAAMTDRVTVTSNVNMSGLQLWGEVTVAGTVTYYVSNATAGAVDPGNRTYSIRVDRNA
jgi:hypothetical protein